MLVATAAAWVPLYLQRRGAHQPNVDDYLYTLVSRQLAHAGSFTDFVHALLHTGQHAPLVVLLAAPGAVHGVDGAVAVELPLLLLLATSAWLLARRWVPPWEAALIGFAAAANQAVLGWALMVHFSVAASALSLLSLAAYLWSDGFRSWGWSAITGVAVGLLLLSRSLAPVYVASFAVVVGLDVIRRRRLPLGQTSIAVLLAAAVAGPWWLVSGGTALHYLRTAGYESSSGFTSSGAHLSLTGIVNRVRWTISDLGTVQSIVLLAAPLVAFTRVRRMKGALVVLGWLLLTLVGLATSSNVGTGFGLPVVAVAITLTGALLLARRRPASSSSTEPASTLTMKTGAKSDLEVRVAMRSVLLILAGLVVSILLFVLLVHSISQDADTRLSWPLVAIAVLTAGNVLAFRPLAATALIAVLAVGFAAEWTGKTAQSWLGPPYRRMALQATNGGRVPNIDAVHREVARAIAGRPALLVRDDDLLNGNGLIYTATTNDLQQSLVPAPFGDSEAGIRKLKDAQLLIAGTSPAPYHRYASLVEAAAARDGWRKTRVWTLACGNTIALWQRRAAAPGRLAVKRAHTSTSSPYASAVLADSPATFWRLGGNTCNAADASAHGNTGIYGGKPKLGAHPLIADSNPSVHFDGKNDQITFLDSPSLSPTKAISIEAWVRPDAVPTVAGSAWQLVSKWNTALLFLQAGPKPQFVFALYDAKKSDYEPRVLSTANVSPRHVYHVVGTYDGSKMRIYVNGSLEATVARSGPLTHATYGGVIGAKGWGTLPSPHFYGSLDEIAIYGHALSSARVKAHYTKGTAPYILLPGGREPPSSISPCSRRTPTEVRRRSDRRSQRPPRGTPTPC
jgi:hypothetical protein